MLENSKQFEMNLSISNSIESREIKSSNDLCSTKPERNKNNDKL